MATRLELAEKKLSRLEKEFDEATQQVYTHQQLTNGQPMNDKRNSHAWFHQHERMENKVFNLLNEIKNQKECIEILKDREFKKNNHLTSNYGLQTSVYNIDKLKERKQDKKTRAKVEILEKMVDKSEHDKKVMSEATKELIKNGSVSQWKKQPIYYFVKGLKKVAFVIDENGDFKPSQKYPIKDGIEKTIIDDLLSV